MKNQNVNKKERKELQRFTYQINKKAPRYYPYILVLMIVFVHVLDTYSTEVIPKVQSLYVNEFFVIGKGLTFERGLQQATLISTIGYAFVMIAPFYKALMDKVGRRPIFIINIVGMFIGMFLCFISANFIVFAAGQMLIAFFVMHDMQMIYVYEVAPSKWRSTLYFSCKFIGLLGTLAIPFFREVFVQEDGSGWRNVFLVPVLIGIIIFMFALFFMRESDIFLKNRLAYLEKSQEERNKEKLEDKKKPGIIPAFKYILKNKQLKWLGISLIATCTALYAITMYYESYMSTTLSIEGVTRALYFQPLSMSITFLFCGFMCDFLGRKKTLVIFSVICLMTFVIFIVSVAKMVSPTIIGILLGLYMGGFWNVTDINGMMFAESSPTELRGSIMGAQALILAIGTAISLLFCLILLSFTSLYYVMMIVGAPGLAMGAVLTILKLRETKGTNLEDIKYE